MRNAEAYPAVRAYLCGVRRKTDDGLVKPAGIQLGKRVMLAEEAVWM